MNNYNMSDSGENIEFSVFYDIDLAGMYFNEWLEGADGTQVNKISLGGRDRYLYLIGESEAPYYKKAELNKLSKDSIFELWLNYEFGYNVSINDYPAHEFISDLLSVSIKRHYEWLASQGDTDGGAYEVYATCGYSQGDYAEYCYIGDMPNWYKNHINHIFWDCPITICAQINGIDYHGEDFLYNVYEYDTDAIRARIAELDISAYAKQWLSDNLPAEPNYL